MAKTKDLKNTTFTDDVKERFLGCTTPDELRRVLDGYNIGDTDKSGNNILHYYLNNIKSFKLGWREIIPEILSRELDINQKQTGGQFQRSALHIAVLLK